MTDSAAASVAPPCSPAEMPDLRLTLVDGWRRPSWRALARSGIVRARRVGASHWSNVNEALRAYTGFEQRVLSQAELLWVGPEMCDLLYATAKRVPDETLVEHLELPSAFALVLFAKPWQALDAASGSRTVHVDAITWGPASFRETAEARGVDTSRMTTPRLDRKALGISSYRLLDFDAGLSRHELEMAATSQLVAEARTTRLQPDKHGNPQLAVHGRHWVPLGRSDWPIDVACGERRVAIETADGFVVRDDEQTLQSAYMNSAIEDRQLVAALSMLINTRTMASLDDEHLPRPVRRRSQRAGVASDVKVVYLRRPQHAHVEHDSDDEAAHVEWSHRWIVNAHPRLQPYGPGRSLRKLIMVPPHVKGPDSKPLVIKDTVKAWVR